VSGTDSAPIRECGNLKYCKTISALCLKRPQIFAKPCYIAPSVSRCTYETASRGGWPRWRGFIMPVSDISTSRNFRNSDFPHDEVEFADAGPATISDKEITAPEDVALSREEELELRRVAVNRHRNRALRQILNAFAVIFISAAALPFWNIALAAPGVTSIDFLGISIQSGAWGVWAVVILVAIIVAIISLQVVQLLWYRREKLKDWDTFKAEAAANDPQTSAAGYMHIFRLYARTKRRATYSMLFGVVWLWWACAGAFVMIMNFSGSAASVILSLLISTQIIIAVCVIAAGYIIGRSFLPGQVLVYNTLIINFRAATSQTHYDRAREEAIRVQNGIMRDRPWWFFRFHKIPAG